MKKILTAIALACALVFNANASITIAWSVYDNAWAGFGIYDSTGGQPGTVGDNWLCQLIDAGTSAPDYNALFTAYEGGTWNQGTVLDSGNFNGALHGFSSEFVSPNNSLTNHYVSSRFFNSASTQAGFIYSAANSWQAVSETILEFNADTGSSGTINIGGVAALGADTSNTPGLGFTTVQPVPEPTSLALFGLGGLLVGLRRKLRKS